MADEFNVCADRPIKGASPHHPGLLRFRCAHFLFLRLSGPVGGRLNRERMQQRCELRRLFKESRNSVGSRALMSMMRELGYQIGRFKVRNLMKEAGLASKQPGAHRYKVARSERPDIPNLLAREFDVQQPNQVWVAISPMSGPVVAGITWQRCLTCTPGGSWAGRCLISLMQNWQSKHWRWPISSGVAHPVCYFTLTRAAIWQPSISTTTVALSYDPEHESAWKLLG